MSDKEHALQIGINADIDEIEEAAERAANAVNRYLGTVHGEVGEATAVIVSLGSAGGSGSTRAIGFEIPEQAEYEDEEVEEDGEPNDTQGPRG